MWKYYGAALLILCLDQWTKKLVAEKMDLGESIPLIEHWLYLTSHRNAGAAFGILQGQRWLFIVVTVAVVAVIVYAFWKMRHDEPLCWSLSLILGGAVGNLLDRIRFGEVVDFIDVRIFGYHYPIFNVADSAVVIGGVLLALMLWRGGARETRMAAKLSERSANDHERPSGE
ncbi:MAG: signal peptidase II [Bacillaceae bacterium G1]|nr:signal peptidase II [Bacillota bacterium]OJF17520.1 MAG: signal peptidase II [Bacillaceae bacterium G1]